MRFTLRSFCTLRSSHALGSFCALRSPFESDREPEIRYGACAVGFDQNVARLDVSVSDGGFALETKIRHIFIKIRPLVKICLRTVLLL